MATTTACSLLLPHLRVELLITMLTTTRWDPTTRPAAEAELRRALALRRELAGDGYWN